MKLPELGVRRPTAVLMLFFGVLLLGAVAYVQLPIDLMPEIEPPSIMVVTTYPGASAKDVEQQVTKVIENELSIVSDLDEITSNSKDNLSVVSCKFAYGTNLDEASNEMRDNLEFAKRRLPDDADRPMIFKFSSSMVPILFIGFTAEQSAMRLHKIVEKQVVDPLKQVTGVGAVQVFGGLKRQINVHLDRLRMEATGVSIEQVQRLLAAANLEVPAGSVKVGPMELAIRLPGEFGTVDQIRSLEVKLDKSGLVHLRDIARVEDGFAEERRDISIDGRPGMIILVQKRSGYNTTEVCDAAGKSLATIAKGLPPDVQYHLIMDSSDFIKRSISNLQEAVLWGAFFVALVTLAFLRRPAPSLIIVLTIPFSLIIAFIYLFVAGQTINMMSMASLAIAIGMVVDNAIVIVENITTHMDRGVRPREAAMFGASEVGVAISASTFTTVVIFVPLMFVPGIVGIIFRQLGAVISITMLASLFTALTLTPMLCSKLLRRSPGAGERQRNGVAQRLLRLSERGFDRAVRAYRRVIGWALAHRPVVLLVGISSLIGALFLVPGLGTEFFPAEDTGELSMTAELRVGTRVKETARVAEDLREALVRIAGDALQNSFYRAGESEGGIASAFGEKEGSHIAVIGAKLVPMLQRTVSSRQIVRELADYASAHHPEIVKLSTLAGSPIEQLILSSGKPISIQILGEDLAQTARLAEQIKTIMASTPGAVDPTISLDMGKPEVQIVVDRAKAASLGLSIANVGLALRSYFYGHSPTEYREHGDEYDVFVRLDERDRRTIEDIRHVPVESMLKKAIPLGTFADVRQALGPVEIHRKNQTRLVTVDADSYGRSVGEVYRDIDRQIQQHIDLPQGVSLQTGGVIKELLASFHWLYVALALGVILVYMVMAAQFESLLHPFVILFAIPFSFVGVAVSLVLTGQTINVVSLIGAIMLIGIVVNDAIVLVDYTNLLRKRGVELFEAARTAAAQRLRPVLLTTITTVCGMMPLALSRGEGSEVWKPLGVTMIGGLLLATLVTLVLVPVLYSLVEQWRQQRRQPKASEAAS